MPPHAYQPVIKWPGSKRRVAAYLAALLPEGGRYYEPFVGGGALLPLRGRTEAVAGDVIPELIALWTSIRDAPDETADAYAARWQRLQDEGHTAYYAIRDAFNATRDPDDFLFLSRTCVNGLIRFNADGDFNNSLHHSRPGIAPPRLRRIIDQWSTALAGVSFQTADYRDTLAPVREGDVVFLDPPYAGTRGRYHPAPFDAEALYDELHRLNRVGARWLLTYDGRAGQRRYLATPPRDVYRACFSLRTGNAPFTKVMQASVEPVVESVYTNYEPPARSMSRHRRPS